VIASAAYTVGYLLGFFAIPIVLTIFALVKKTKRRTIIACIVWALFVAMFVAADFERQAKRDAAQDYYFPGSRVEGRPGR